MMNKYQEIDALKFGLNKHQRLEELSPGNIGIVKMRKSRIIMKDGKQISDMAEAIKLVDNKLKVSLIISGPICSKTVKYLNENNIEIISR